MIVHCVSAPVVCWFGWYRRTVVPQMGLVVEWAL